MSFVSEGTTLPHSISRVVGSNLQPVIIHVPGRERSELENILELQGHCTYIALFGQKSGHVSAYVGMTSCGQDRPRVGKHLFGSSSIIVIADAGNSFSEADVMVLERFFFAKISECTGWTMRCELPRARGVGMDRFCELMGFGAQVLMLLRQRFGLFENVSHRNLINTPLQFEQIPHPIVGGTEGQKMVLDSFGVKAKGIDLGENGFFICSGSVIRAAVVPSAAGVTAARREELVYNGQLRALDEDYLLVLRAIWRSSKTSAAKFVTGSSASAADWRPLKPRLYLVWSAHD